MAFYFNLSTIVFHISILAASVVYVCSLIFFFFSFSVFPLHIPQTLLCPLFHWFLIFLLKKKKNSPPFLFGRFLCVSSQNFNLPPSRALFFGVRLSSPCPEYRTIRQADGARIRSCIYSLDSRPYYRNSLRNFSFVFDMANALPPALPVKQHIAAIDIDAHS